MDTYGTSPAMRVLSYVKAENFVRRHAPDVSAICVAVLYRLLTCESVAGKTDEARARDAQLQAAAAGASFAEVRAIYRAHKVRWTRDKVREQLAADPRAYD